MKKILRNILGKLSANILERAHLYQEENIRRQLNLPKSVRIYRVSVEGNVTIGENTYVNEGSRIDTGSSSSIQIGSHCAIGRYVHITSKTHNLRRPTTDETNSFALHLEDNVRIGNYVWIGDNVIVLPGVIIGNYAVVGAGSIVKKNVKDFEIVAGVPAEHIRFNTNHHLFPKQPQVS